MSATFDQLHELHDIYVEMTGKCANYSINEAVYHDFIKKGFTCNDLRIVLAYLARENRRMRGAQYSTRLDLLMDWEYRRFDSLLSEAKAHHRNRCSPKTARESVLNSFRPVLSESVTGLPRSVKDILAELSK